MTLQKSTTKIFKRTVEVEDHISSYLVSFYNISAEAAEKEFLDDPNNIFQ